MYDFLLRADYSAPPTFGEGGGMDLRLSGRWIALEQDHFHHPG
ncbi:MAG: hypothetical protein CM1200mP39_11790 [Dehalococcoidia bacterium]|nr:MAG: hypothetical protein CM1200mP39_11790 [Dehalococcoidia bacterium]